MDNNSSINLQEIRKEISTIIESNKLVKDRVNKISNHTLDKNLNILFYKGDIGRRIKYSNIKDYFRLVVGYNNRRSKLCILVKIK